MIGFSGLDEMFTVFTVWLWCVIRCLHRLATAVITLSAADGFGWQPAWGERQQHSRLGFPQAGGGCGPPGARLCPVPVPVYASRLDLRRETQSVRRIN